MTATIWRLGLLAAAGATFTSGTANAKILLITTGTTVSTLGKVQVPQLPPPQTNPKAAAPRGKTGPPPGLPNMTSDEGQLLAALFSGNAEVCYKYEYGGVFWIDFWTWDGEYCLQAGGKHYIIPGSLAAELLGRDSPPSRPFLYKFPLGLLILGGVVLFGVVRAVVTARRDTREERNDEDLDQYRVERK